MIMVFQFLPGGDEQTWLATPDSQGIPSVLK